MPPEEKEITPRCKRWQTSRFIVNISMRKMILEVGYSKSMIYEILKIFRRITFFIPRWSYDIYFAWKIQKNTGLLILNSLKQRNNIFNFIVNRNWKKLTDSRKRAKILADNRKCHHPIETLFPQTLFNWLKAFPLNNQCVTRGEGRFPFV